MAKQARTPRSAQPAAKKQRVDKTAPPPATLKKPPKPSSSNTPPTDKLKPKSKGKQKATPDRAPTPPPKPKPKPKTKPQDAPPALPTTFKVIAGSYEKLLYGLEGTTTAAPDAGAGADNAVQFHLKPVFIFPAHVSCIKAVAASPGGGKWLATGSADEIIKVWDLRRRKEVGGLMHHEGSITHLGFPSRSHLLSAAEDGTLCLFRARNWSVLRALRGHKGRVNAVAVHPSGKAALSVGKDKALRMWDLMRGRGVASTKLGKEGEIVRWSTDGELFAVQAGSTIDLYNTDMALLHTINHPSRLHDILFCKRVASDGELLFAAAEDGKLSIYDISNDPRNAPKIIAAMVGHTNRVKAVQTLRIALPPPSGRASTTIVCTASSDGKIHLYDLAMLPKPALDSDSAQGPVEIPPQAEYDSKGTRLTCLTVADGEAEGARMGGKRKRDGEGSDEESDNDGDAHSIADGDSEEGEEEENQNEDEEDEEEEEEEAEYEEEDDESS